MFRAEKEKHNGSVITSLLFGSIPWFRSVLNRLSKMLLYKTKEARKKGKQEKRAVDNEGMIRQILFPKITMWYGF